MTTLLFFIAVGFFVVRATRRRKRASVPRATPVTRSHALGDAGEAVVHDELRRVLTSLCGENFYLHPTALLLNHAPGRPFPTAEVDHLVVTPFGIYIVETKNWTGRIEPGPDPDSVVRIGADGQREIRRSPLAQNRSKVAFLRGMLPGIWNIDGVGVFAHDACALSSVLPSGLIGRADLNLWMREQKSHHESRRARDVNVVEAWRAISSVCAINANGIDMARHRELVGKSAGFPKATY
jgi:hypothetical protein